MSTIFERIISGELQSEKVYEDEKLIVIHDIHPNAPIHLLIIPKKHYENLQDVPLEDISIISEIAKCAQKLAKDFELEEGYRLLTNNGPYAGQTVFHLHFHLLGGKSLGSIG